MSRCLYPECTRTGKCPISALWDGRRCAEKRRSPEEQRELDARIPLGDNIWRDGVRE